MIRRSMTPHFSLLFDLRKLDYYRTVGHRSGRRAGGFSGFCDPARKPGFRVENLKFRVLGRA